MAEYNNFYYMQYIDELESNPGYNSSFNMESPRAHMLQRFNQDSKMYTTQLPSAKETSPYVCENPETSKKRIAVLYKGKPIAVRKAVQVMPTNAVSGVGPLRVQMCNKRVQYTIYENQGNKILGSTRVRFYMTLVYHNLLRKWCISPGYSFVPEVIELKDKLRSGTSDPLSDEVMNIAYDVQRATKAYMTRLIDLHQFIRDAQQCYKDMQFHLELTLRKIQLTCCEGAWPSDLQRWSLKDNIVVELTLNRKLRVCDISYVYTHADIPKDEKAICTNRLRLKLQHFYGFSLERGLERFMT